MSTNRAHEKKAITTYSAVLLDATANAKEAFDMCNELVEAHNVIADHSQLHQLIKEGVLSPDALKDLIDDIFSDFSEGVLGALRAMAVQEDLDLIKKVAEELEEAAEAKYDTAFVHVTTVVSLDDKLREMLLELLKQKLKKDIYLYEMIDPSILGGIVMSAHGKRIDASVSKQLKNMRGSLSSISIGGES